MRSPGYSSGAARRPETKHAETDYYQYLAPESFTVLPLEEQVPTANSARVPEPNKLTPRSKRRKNQAFSIIAEPTSQASSRSTSPTDRVSPFRGRGFNPIGSRHASPERSLQPNSSPENQPKSSSTRASYIPKPIRRRSSAEDLFSPESSPTNGGTSHGGSSNLNGNKYSSRSMTNIAPRHLASKPPPSPRRNANLKISFVRLSPIIGSSPGSGSDQTMSSPSKIPLSKNQSNRIASPNPTGATSSRPASRGPSRPNSRPSSRSNSPSKSPSKIPLKSTTSYKNIPAKVDSFHRTTTAAKPKVPQKPKVYSTRTTNSDRSKTSMLKKNLKSQMASNSGSKRDFDDTETTDTDRDAITSRGRMSSSQFHTKSGGSAYNYTTKRKDTRSRVTGKEKSTKSNERSRTDYEKSMNSSRYSSKESLQQEQNTTFTELVQIENSRNISKEKSSSSLYSTKEQRTRPGTTKPLSSIGSSGLISSTASAYNKNGAKTNSRAQDTTTTDEISRTEDETTEDGRDDDILSVTIDSLGPSTTQIVSATTETVTKPLNIEAKLLKPSEVGGLAQGDVHTSTSPSIAYANSQKTSPLDANLNVSKITSTNNLNVTSNINSRTLNSSNMPVNGSTVNSTKTMENSVANQQNTINQTNSNKQNTTKQNTTNLNSTQQNSPNAILPTESSPENNRQVSESGNNNLKRVTHADSQNLSNLEKNVRNSLNSLTPADSEKVTKSLLESPRLSNSTNEKIRQARTVIVDEIKPIKITVREKTGDMEVQSGNFVLPRSATNGITERPFSKITPKNIAVWRKLGKYSLNATIVEDNDFNLKTRMKAGIHA